MSLSFMVLLSWTTIWRSFLASTSVRSCDLPVPGTSEATVPSVRDEAGGSWMARCKGGALFFHYPAGGEAYKQIARDIQGGRGAAISLARAHH